ncbi:MAG TPA: hypothetical protein VNG13_14535 [Mycobacteriales bacterium]|nr:hypothetical protein [Mycobacteriales bacterium]
MALWFLRGLRRGVVTTHYPAGPPDPWTATLPSPPVFSSAALTRELVAELVAVCPSHALSIEGDDTLVYDVGGCTGCGRCLAVAGDAATPSGVIELAATDRRQLVKRIRLPEETR